MTSLFARVAAALTLAAMAALSLFGYLAAGVAAIVLVAAMNPVLAADTVTVIPYGDWLASVADVAAQILLPILLALFARLLAVLPRPVADLIRTMRIEQLLSRAVDYGTNAVAGAAKGKALSVDLGPDVLNQAANYALQQAPRLVASLGGSDALRRMILARLELEAAASAADVLTKAITKNLTAK